MTKKQILDKLETIALVCVRVSNCADMPREIRYCITCNAMLHCIEGYRIKHETCKTRLRSISRLNKSILNSFLERAERWERNYAGR